MYLALILALITMLPMFLSVSKAFADDEITKVEDVVIPTKFNKYVIEKSMVKSALFQSGIVQNTPEFDALATGGGKTIEMPYWKAITGNSEVLSDTNALTSKKTSADHDTAVMLRRGVSWDCNDLAGILAGDDPMAAIGDQVADFWVRDMQDTLISLLKGAFLSTALLASNVKDVTSASGVARMFTASTFIDACQLLGDAQDSLSGIILHSSTRAVLAKADLITTIRDSEGKVVMETFMGKRVICDDRCPVSTTTFTSYIFGPGAIAFGNGVAKLPIEFARDAQAGNDIIVSRRHYIMHPRGVAFTSSSVAGSSPTNLELEMAANWLKKYDTKAIKIVQFKHQNTSA